MKISLESVEVKPREDSKLQTYRNFFNLIIHQNLCQSSPKVFS